MREGIADKNLIAKWKKQGYENLCCLRCIQARDTNFGTNCICRVPKAKLEEVMDFSLVEFSEVVFMLISLTQLRALYRARSSSASTAAAEDVLVDENLT